MPHEAENEAYHRLQEGTLNKPAPKDDGTDRRKTKSAKSKAAKKALKQSARGALNATNMHYHEDEKFIQQYYRGEFVKRVMDVKGELSIEDSLLIDMLAYACVRVYRKSRLESMFGRFMDRTAPQDPVQQILGIVKQLGISSKVKGNETSGKEVVSKLLANEAASLENAENGISFEEWQMAEITKGKPTIQRRAMTDFAESEDYFKVHPEPEQVDSEMYTELEGEG